MSILILNRILKSVPVLLLVAMLTFALFNASKVDPVITALELEGVDILEENIYNGSDYSSMYHKLGLNKPPFYFSVQPNHYPPNTLAPIYNPFIKEAYRTKLKQGLGSSQLDATYKAYLDFLQSKDSCMITKPEIFDIVPLRMCKSPEADNYVNSVKSLDSSKSTFFYPVIRFYGLDNQFHTYLIRIFTFDLGRSKLDGKAVSHKISHAFKWTLALVIPTVLLSFLFSFLLGYYQALHKNSLADKWIQWSSYVVYIIPSFLLASLFVVFLTTKEYGAWTNIFPSVDVIVLNENEPWLSMFKNAKYLILPMFIMVLHNLAYLSRQVKSSILIESEKPYALGSSAKGLSKAQIFRKHLLPNGMIPLITIFTDMIPLALTGSVIIEEIFNLPGCGRLLFRSLELNDYSISLPLILLFGLLTILSYLFGDILYQYANPKIKIQANGEN